MSKAQASAQKVRALLNPANVAIVGASDRPGSWSKNVWRALRRCGFQGRIFPVNPRATTLWDGEVCYPSLADLPEKPDHVAVLVPGAGAIDAIREAGRAGARSATVFTSGFGEGGDEAGRLLGEQLTAAVIESGLAVSGPNCMGNLAAPFAFSTIPDDRIAELPAGTVGLFGQSGGIVMAIYRALRSRGIMPAYAVTSGNEVGLTTADYIRFMVQDSTVKVICCFIEAIRDADDFLDACRYARASGKPIIAMKIGGSEASRAAALAHTGSLAGSLACFDAVTRPLGVLRVDTIDQMVETAEFLTHAEIPRGARAGAITFSGGLKGLLLEAAERHDASFPNPSPETVAKLKEILGVGTSLGNPLDAGFAALSSAEAYFKCIDIMLDDPNIDVLLVQEELPLQEGMNAKAKNLIEVDRMVHEGHRKPVAVVSMATYMYSDFTRTFRNSFPHLPVLHEVDKAVGTVARVGHLASLPPAEPHKVSALPEGAEALLARGKIQSDGRRVLDETASKDLLALAGLRLPRERVAQDGIAAVAAAREIGFPVVLKLVSDDIQHKSDIGGVKLNLASEGAVRDAFEAIRQNLIAAKPGAHFGGVLVAEMVSGGQELVVGIHRDPEVGLVTMFGTGGVLLELQKDVCFGPVPLSAAQAADMIDRTMAGKLLAGYRGSPALDRQAVIDTLVNISQLAATLGERLESVDINPLLARPSGEGAIALDGLVVLTR